MANEQLIDYIQKGLGKGVSEEQIRQALIKAGWTTTDINDAFESIKKSEKSEPEQILKGIIEGEIKKEKITGEPIKTEESWFSRKKILIFTIIGLFTLIIIYYVYEYIQSLK